MSLPFDVAIILGVRPATVPVLCCQLHDSPLFKRVVRTLSEARKGYQWTEKYLSVGGDWYVVIQLREGTPDWHVKFPFDYDHTRLNNTTFSWMRRDVELPEWVSDVPLRARNW